MATNRDVLMAVGRLEAQMADTRTDIKDLSVYVMGNGTPENGLMHRMARIEEGMASVKAHVGDKKIHGLGWWKHRYILVVVALIGLELTAAAIVASLVVGNQALLLAILDLWG